MEMKSNRKEENIEYVVILVQGNYILYPYEYYAEFASDIMEPDMIICHMGTLLDCMDFLPKTKYVQYHEVALNLSNECFESLDSNDRILVPFTDEDCLILSVYKYKDWLESINNSILSK